MIVERIYFGRSSAWALAQAIALVYFRAKQGRPSSMVLAAHYRGERMIVRNPLWTELSVLH